MYKSISVLLIVLLLPYQTASGLTFKSDGSVVQSSGEVVKASFADRFANAFSSEELKKSIGKRWPVAGSSQNTDGFLGDDLFMPGTPLLSVANIKKGADYVEVLMKQNGFADKDSLQRYIVANANPEFLDDLGLSGEQAINFVGAFDASALEALPEEYSDRIGSLVSELSSMVADKIQSAVEDEVQSQVESEVESYVADTVSQAVEENLDNWWDSYGPQWAEENGASSWYYDAETNGIFFEYD